MKKFGVYCLAILQALAGCTVGMYLAPQMAKKTVSADMEGFLLLAGINALMTALILFFAVWAVQLTLGRQCAFWACVEACGTALKIFCCSLPCALAVSAPAACWQWEVRHCWAACWRRRSFCWSMPRRACPAVAAVAAAPVV